MKRIATSTVLLVGILCFAAAHAESPPMAASQATQDVLRDDHSEPLQDEVRTHSGDVFRGVIVERGDGGAVTIELVSGGRRVIAGDDLLYVGPVGAFRDGRDTHPSRPVDSSVTPDRDANHRFDRSAAQSSETFRLRIRSASGDTLYLQQARTLGADFDGYFYLTQDVVTDLCATPCDVQIGAGALRLRVLEERARDYHPVEMPVFMRRDLSIEISRTSHRRKRRAMFATGGIFLAGGLTSAGFVRTNDRRFVAEGAVIGMLVGLGIGTLMTVFGANIRDTYRYTVLDE